MRQPKWETPIDDLREYLQFAVPLRAADLAHKLATWGYTRTQATVWLTSEARRAGDALGGRGDTIQFSDGKERTGQARDRVTRTVDDLVTGIAAAALLAQLHGHGGATALGDYYGTDPQPRQQPAGEPTPDTARFHQILDELEALMIRGQDTGELRDAA